MIIIQNLLNKNRSNRKGTDLYSQNIPSSKISFLDQKQIILYNSYLLSYKIFQFFLLLLQLNRWFLVLSSSTKLEILLDKSGVTMVPIKDNQELYGLFWSRILLQVSVLDQRSLSTVSSSFSVCSPSILYLFCIPSNSPSLLIGFVFIRFALRLCWKRQYHQKVGIRYGFSQGYRLIFIVLESCFTFQINLVFLQSITEVSGLEYSGILWIYLF